MQPSEAQVHLDITVFVLSNSETRFAEAMGEFLADDERSYWRDTRLRSLVATYRLRSNEEAVAAAVMSHLEPWHVSLGPDQRGMGSRPEGDEKWALLTLLSYLGPPGQKAIVRFWQPDAPPLAARNDEWVKYLREDAAGRAEALGGEPVDGASFGDPLLWELATGDGALARLVSELDAVVERREHGEHVDAPDLTIDRIRRLAPTTGGVSDTKLREWMEQPWATEVQWGAALALSRRGDGDAVHRVHTVVHDRFEMTETDRLATGREQATLDLGFQFVVELAASPLDDRWALLLDLLRDPQSSLLIPRAAALLALEDHWDELTASQAADALETVRLAHWNEDSDWLQTEMVTFLASRSAPPTTPTATVP